MTLTKLLKDELDAEAERSRRALQQVPDNQHDWKPHDKSMIFGYLTNMVANIPMWVAMIITQDELDVKPAAGESKLKYDPMQTSAQYLALLERSLTAARTALDATTDAHLMTSWRLLAGGTLAVESARFTMIRDTLNHWVHHRGQMTVYLRLMGAKVPALYGPSADDSRF